MFTDDLTKNVKATLYDRVTCPFVSTFVIAWIVSNWRIILTLLAKIDYDKKIDVITQINESCFCRLNFYFFKLEISTYIVRGLLIPLGVALGYIYIYPYFAEKFFRSWQNYISNKKNIKTEAEAKELLDSEEATALRKLLEAEKTKYQDFIKSNRERSHELQANYDIAKKNIQKYQEEMNEFNVTIKEFNDDKDKEIKQLKREHQRELTKCINAAQKKGEEIRIKMEDDFKVMGESLTEAKEDSQKAQEEIKHQIKQYELVKVYEDYYTKLRKETIKLVKGYESPSQRSGGGTGLVHEAHSLFKTYASQYDQLTGEAKEEIKIIVKDAGCENVFLDLWTPPAKFNKAKWAPIFLPLFRYYALTLILNSAEMRKYINASKK